jgi:hypothetical protein
LGWIRPAAACLPSSGEDTSGEDAAPPFAAASGELDEAAELSLLAEGALSVNERSDSSFKL